MLKCRGPKVEPWALQTLQEKRTTAYQKYVQISVYYQDNYETNQHNWKTAQHY
jgi:hypothetical protein